jgi:hypothetical protein
LINFIIYLLISTYLTKIETVNSYLILLVCVGIIGIVSYAYYRFIIIQIELTIAKKKYTDNAKNEIVKDEQTKNQPTSGIANK